MPPVQLLLKPASGHCNLRCKYCFYLDEMEHRAQESFGPMSLETLERLLSRAFQEAEGSVTVAFQGGEPTVRGLEFFERAVELAESYNVKKLPVRYAIQTNGVAVDEAWARFFAKNHFLVGLSLDGTRETHDAFRRDMQGRGSFERALRAADLFDKQGVEYNILTVVNRLTARHIQRIYAFYRQRGFLWQQYIPCLEPLGDVPGGQDYSLTPRAYGAFLKKLFDLWYRDFRQRKFVSIRLFENFLSVLLGRPPEQCDLRGVCSCQNVVEADGSVYPCDFYVVDEYRLGSVWEDSFSDLGERARERGFGGGTLALCEECRACPYVALCRGGCRRYREPGLEKTFLCGAYREFFDYALPRLQECAAALRFSR